MGETREELTQREGEREILGFRISGSVLVLFFGLACWFRFPVFGSNVYFRFSVSVSVRSCFFVYPVSVSVSNYMY